MMISYDPFENPEKLSKEDKEILLKMFTDAMEPNPLAQVKDKDGNLIGKVVVFGTGSNEDTTNALKAMFMNPESYKFLNFRDNQIFDEQGELKSSIGTYKRLTPEEIIDIYGGDLTPEDFNKLKLPFKY